MDANGRHQRRLTNQALANEPDWSPDGRRIVFSGGTDQPGYSGLRTVNIKTGRLTRAAVGSVLDSCSGLVAGRNADRLR
jgi:Tol biopolymer transport system component